MRHQWLSGPDRFIEACPSLFPVPRGCVASKAGPHFHFDVTV
jgi:hypothetical protein